MVELPPWKIRNLTFRALALHQRERWRANDKGLMLKTSAFQIFHDGNSPIINSLDKTRFLFHSPTNTAPQFL